MQPDSIHRSAVSAQTKQAFSISEVSEFVADLSAIGWPTQVVMQIKQAFIRFLPQRYPVEVKSAAHSEEEVISASLSFTHRLGLHNRIEVQALRYHTTTSTSAQRPIAVAYTKLRNQKVVS